MSIDDSGDVAYNLTLIFGPIAQLGERHNGIVEVKGSSPFGSTPHGVAAINQSGTAEAPFVSERRGAFSLFGACRVDIRPSLIVNREL